MIRKLLKIRLYFVVHLDYALHADLVYTFYKTSVEPFSGSDRLPFLCNRDYIHINIHSVFMMSPHPMLNVLTPRLRKLSIIQIIPKHLNLLPSSLTFQPNAPLLHHLLSLLQLQPSQHSRDISNAVCLLITNLPPSELGTSEF
jgi:hypothetical protein